MSDGPPPLPETPIIPPGQLWACLLAPPFFLGAVIAIAYLGGNSKLSSLDPSLIPTTICLLGIGVFLGCLVRLVQLMRHRYPPSTILLLVIVYIFCQGILACMIFFGACVMAINA
jgi:hypothetical protein